MREVRGAQEARQSLSLLILPGDGIGPEVTEAARRVLEQAAARVGCRLKVEEGLIGGAAYDQEGHPVSEATLQRAQEADAVLLGAVGGPRYDTLPPAHRPERGLLALRAALGVYANLRPARCFPALLHNSPLKESLIAGADLLFVRELIGGIYFGQPSVVEGEGESRLGYDTMRYSVSEIKRVAAIAFQLAAKRSGRLTSVDKANVLSSSRLWRETLESLAPNYPTVTLEHIYVDNCAMQLTTAPSRFDVLVTGNLFGDILSDEAAALTGSLGLLPSAALGEGAGLYEPVHGSAPDIAGRGIANPIAAVLSAALLLRWSAGQGPAAAAIERAVELSLDQGLRTADIYTGAAGEREVGTKEITDAICAALDQDALWERGEAEVRRDV
ncbi:MAG: 3-isopropylmalate dehydrogenase [Myxococcota bacterium]|nr:3-isopropylmalate dehydrogenase [Myxococcota bacterium]